MGELWISPLLKVMNEEEAASEQKQHHTIEEPSLSRLANHPAEGVGQGRRQEHDGQHFDEVAERCRIFVGMGAVGVKEASAVRAQILDDFKGGHWALGYDLPGALDGGCDCILVEIHGHALPDQQ